MVQEVASKADPEQPEVYRLKLSCPTGTRQAEIQLSWAPRPAPSSGQILSSTVDGKATAKHSVEGKEKMGNGSDGTTGPAALMLPMARLPDESLTISGLFANETVVFPFNKLTPAMRQELSLCFPRQ
jgi:hypothetical protein